MLSATEERRAVAAPLELFAVLAASMLALAVLPSQAALAVVVVLHVAHVLLRPEQLVVTCVGLDVLLLTVVNSVLVPADLRIPTVGIVVAVSAVVVLASRLRFRVAATPFLAAIVLSTVLAQFFGRGGDSMIQVVAILAIGVLASCLAGCLTDDDRLQVAQVLLFLSGMQVAIALGADVIGIEWIQSNLAAADPNGTGRAVYSASVNLILPGGWSRSAGTLGHPIPFALFLLIGLCLALRVPGVAPRTIRWSMVALLGLGVALSGSRTTVMVALILLSIYFAGVGRRLWRALILVLAVPVASFVVYRFADFALQNARERSSFSLDFRLQAWKSFLGLFDRDLAELVIGSGPESDSKLQTLGVLDLQGLQSLDNQFVTSFADLGLLGLGVYLVLLVATLLRRSGPEWFALAAIWGMFLSFDVMGWPVFVFLFWFFVESMLRSPTGPVGHGPGPADDEGAPALEAPAAAGRR